ncbi:hypothetical protein IAU60_003228 [Kwoniella sp. DSM 27419]
MPRFDSFACLWLATTGVFSAELASAVARYIQLIHATERKAAGKGNSTALMQARRLPLDIGIVEEGLEIPVDDANLWLSPSADSSTGLANEDSFATPLRDAMSGDADAPQVAAAGVKGRFT